MKNAYAQLSEQYLQKCRSNALDNNNSVKFTSTRGDNSTTKDSMVMKIADTTSYVHKHYVRISEQYLQKCRSNALDNNNSVKFTSSRGDNTTTNDSMVMKIVNSQLHMSTNIMYEFQSSTCKTVGETLRTIIIQ